MDPINLGPGLAPAVTIVDGRVYVAFGVQPDALVLVTLTRAGTVLSRTLYLEGFFDSWPRFSGPWLAFKRGGDWRPVALNVVTGQRWVYRGQADGNFGVIASADLNLVAYQWTASYDIHLGSLLDGDDAPTSMHGAPDGLDELLDRSLVTLRKDTRLSFPGMLYPVGAGDLTVGELADDPGRPNGGIGVQLIGDLLRVALPGQDAPTPSTDTDGDTYAIVTGGPLGVRLLLGSRADVGGLSPVEKEPGPVNNVPPAADPAPPDPEPLPPVPPPADPVPPHHPGPTPPAPTPASQENIMIAYAPPVAGFKPGDVFDNGNGTVSVKKPNGKFLCVNPQGGIEERDTGGGAWESFTKGKASLIAERDGGAAGPQIFVLPFAE
jgi:hypothetical protein